LTDALLFPGYIVKVYEELGSEKVSELVEGVRSVQVTYECPEFKVN
jgi:hypothetical protein